MQWLLANGGVLFDDVGENGRNLKSSGLRLASNGK